MRIRQVKPSFWTDAVMARVSYPARLFYVGLWNVADDAGWIDWDPPSIGAVLFPYESPKRRLSLMERWAKELVDSQRLAVLDCGCAVIPSLPKHQRISGKQSFYARDKHSQEHGTQPSLIGKRSSLSDSPGSGSGSGSGNGTVSGSGSAGARYGSKDPERTTRTGLTRLSDLLPRPS